MAAVSACVIAAPKPATLRSMSDIIVARYPSRVLSCTHHDANPGGHKAVVIA
jgi:hypothetical protein